MGRAFLAAILSGLVMPGLGHLLIGQLRKGALLIALVSLNFILLVIKLLVDLNQVFANIPVKDWESRELLWRKVSQGMVARADFWLVGLLFVLSALWLFGVIDAFRGGLKKSRDSEILNETTPDR